LLDRRVQQMHKNPLIWACSQAYVKRGGVSPICGRDGAVTYLTLHGI